MNELELYGIEFTQKCAEGFPHLFIHKKKEIHCTAWWSYDECKLNKENERDFTNRKWDGWCGAWGVAHLQAFAFYSIYTSRKRENFAATTVSQYGGLMKCFSCKGFLCFCGT